MISFAGTGVHLHVGPTVEKAIVWSAIALIGISVLLLLALIVSGYPGL